MLLDKKCSSIMDNSKVVKWRLIIRILQIHWGHGKNPHGWLGMIVPSVVPHQISHCICGFNLSAYYHILFEVLNEVEVSSTLPPQAQVNRSTVTANIDIFHMVIAANISMNRITW